MYSRSNGIGPSTNVSENAVFYGYFPLKYVTSWLFQRFDGEGTAQ